MVNQLQLPHCVAGEWPEPDHGRFAASILRWAHDAAQIGALSGSSLNAANCSWRGLGLIGLADDEGVRLNGGRVGAREGPKAFRAALAHYGSAGSVGLTGAPAIVDCGDVVPAETLAATHNRVTEATAAIVEQGLLPVGIGGGHDLTFPLVRGVAQSIGPLTGLYFDAHLDVRTEDGSGMPFRRLVEVGCAESLVCLGFNPLVNTEDHLDWYTSHGGRVESFVASDWPGAERRFVSMDLDAVDGSFAPGVSAVNPCGLSSAEISAHALTAGTDRSVCCFDIMELCPRHDENGRTARLAAHLFLQFVRGCANRPAE